MRLKIKHETTYTYETPVSYALQQIRLTPKDRAGQSIINWQTTIEGGTKQASYDDQHNNHVNLVLFEPGRSKIIVRSEGEVETTDNNGVVGVHGGFTPLWYFKRSTPLTKVGSGIRHLVRNIDKDEADITRLHALSALIRNNVDYESGTTNSKTTAEEALETKTGVCQDHAHIFIAAARQLGYPARYVSGYLMMNDRIEQEATHAWAEAHVEGIGWVGFDVSNRICPDERYVRVATGLDYSEAMPIYGLRFGRANAEKMLVSLQVQQ
ncbi:transglutaminase family protein [Ahrensia sp. 13_GOM-1096m]|uniref:transglutaminase family protein n=1 Tax=Ahrensia sp. 13_GOM-1096m TaxID=1380380 RepID=UPI00047EB03D|nr:transglutaminase family protein [Ahrensia sp. 13_GOM-1096m]